MVCTHALRSKIQIHVFHELHDMKLELEKQVPVESESLQDTHLIIFYQTTASTVLRNQPGNVYLPVISQGFWLKRQEKNAIDTRRSRDAECWVNRSAEDGAWPQPVTAM